MTSPFDASWGGPPTQSSNFARGCLIALLISAAVWASLTMGIVLGHRDVAETSTTSTTLAPSTTATVAPATTKAPTTTTTEAPTTTLNPMLRWAARNADTVANIGNTLQDDFGILSDAAGRSDSVAVGRACHKLGVDASRLIVLYDAPDPELVSAFRTAATEYQTGADLCESATAIYSADLLQSAIDHFAKGTSAIGDATAILKGVR